jgi:formylglycine-generating enzyme required for sulfatase activity
MDVHPIALALALFAALPARALSQGASKPGSVSAPARAGAPPGLVLVPGGKTRIGTATADALELGQENEKLFENISRETPQFELKLDDFYLGLTEVTNEQYLAFVQAAEVTPPEAWGEEAIDQAFKEFEEERAELARRAKEEGKPAPPLKPFPHHEWWTKNWRTSPWGLPKGQEALPVTLIDYDMALSYARWAGLRLMSEFEFQRAGRVNGKNAYPWGEKWDPQRCANQEQGTNAPRPVGSFAAGKSELGIHDLSGNVWEWTSSPFAPYPGFKVLQIRVGTGDKKRVVDALVRWDSGQRVVVGGSYNEGAYAARLTTRRPTDRDQAAEGLGFRVAASVAPGLDISEAVLARAPGGLPKGVQFDASQLALADHWTSSAGTAQMLTAAKDGAEELQPLTGYAVITGYDHVLFVPATGIEVTALVQLETRSVSDGPVAMGLLSLTQPALEPALPAGVWLVAFRGPGAVREPSSGAAKAALKLPKDFSGEQSALLFYDPSLEPVAWLALGEVDFAHPEEPRVSLASGKRSVQVPGADGTPTAVEEDVTEASLRVNSLLKVANKAVVYTIPLKFAATAVTLDWRR